MAMHGNEQQTEQQRNQLFLLESLLCEEETWEDSEEVEDSLQQVNSTSSKSRDAEDSSFFPSFSEEDLFWEDEELLSLFSKEKEQKQQTASFEADPGLFLARSEAVDWVLKVNVHYGFSALTATLAINYLDRFLSSNHFQRDKPWMIQLVAVTCLSLAAKVEEIQVPLLLDLQVDDTKYVFDARTIQRMELLVLSSLQWKMHPVTTISFLDHVIRRLGLKTHLHWEFFRRCEHLLLSVVSDSRFVGYLPSVMAAATMMHVIDEVETCDPSGYKDQLLGLLNVSKERLNDCYNLILELLETSAKAANNPHKRKYEEGPGSPSGVVDAFFSCDSSNDSWVVGKSSVCSSTGTLTKRNRSGDKQMKLPSVLNRVFVDIIGSPP